MIFDKEDAKGSPSPTTIYITNGRKKQKQNKL